MEKKKAFVFVPHQDDEINLVGNCIDRLIELYDVYVIFSSIDSDHKMAIIRRDEAIKSCAILGVPKDRVLFLNYPDTPNRAKKHYFTDGDTRIIGDIFALLQKQKPNLIIGTDFDYHSDHKMLSIALESAVGKVVAENHQEYKPLVFKGFCYETAFCGAKDYFQSKYGECVPLNDLLGNPSYIWANRVSLFGDDKANVIWRKKAFRALLAHKSQYAILRADSVLNCDNVFWLRRTDNILLNDRVKISASSGDASRINDFVVLQTSDLTPLEFSKHDFSKALWKPDDNDEERCLKIELDRFHSLNKIVFRGNPSNANKTTVDGEMQIGNVIVPVSEFMPYARETALELNDIEAEYLIIRFKGKVEISEIELFDRECFDCTGYYLETLCKKNGWQKEFFQVGRLYYFLLCLVCKIKRKILSLI